MVVSSHSMFGFLLYVLFHSYSKMSGEELKLGEYLFEYKFASKDLYIGYRSRNNKLYELRSEFTNVNFLELSFPYY